MPEGNEFTKKGSIEFLSDYTGENKKLDLGFGTKLFTKDADGKSPVSKENQIKFFELKQDKKTGVVTYGKKDILYREGAELKEWSAKFEEAKKELGVKYGDKFYSQDVATKINNKLLMQGDKLAKVASADNIGPWSAQGKTEPYENVLKKFQNAIKQINGIDKQLSKEKTYTYSAKINLQPGADKGEIDKNNRPTQKMINRGFAKALQDQQHVTGIDHSTPEGLKKLQQLDPKSFPKDILLEFGPENKQTQFSIKLKSEVFFKTLKNLPQETLHKGDFKQLSVDDRTALAEKIGKVLDDQGIKLNFKGQQATVSFKKDVSLSQDRPVTISSDTPESKAHAVAAALRDQKKWTGIDASTPEGFKK
ncbi:unnamed protein product, partial [Allacma fusca]